MWQARCGGPCLVGVDKSMAHACYPDVPHHEYQVDASVFVASLPLRPHASKTRWEYSEGGGEQAREIEGPQGYQRRP